MSGLVIISLILSLADPSDTDCTVPPPIPVSHTKIGSELFFPSPRRQNFCYSEKKQFWHENVIFMPKSLLVFRGRTILHIQRSGVMCLGVSRARQRARGDCPHVPPSPNLGYATCVLLSQQCPLENLPSSQEFKSWRTLYTLCDATIECKPADRCAGRRDADPPMAAAALEIYLASKTRVGTKP